MHLYVAPMLLGLLIWWSSTGLILFLDGLPTWTFRFSMTGATALLVAALFGLAISAGDTSVHGAYMAFASAVGAWGWLEMSFYMGYVTGPRTRHCRHGCRGWAHFGHAIGVSLYHELAILIIAALVWELTRRGANHFGTWTFVTLWWMHQSARLNVFLGVPNLNAAFLPDHLSHISCFFRQAPMNLLFPFSVTLSTIAAVWLGQLAITHPTHAFIGTGYTLVTTMMALAILEHWFLVLPLPAARAWNMLWNWSLVARGTARLPRPKQPALPTQATIGGHT